MDIRVAITAASLRGYLLDAARGRAAEPRAAFRAAECLIRIEAAVLDRLWATHIET